MGMLGENPVSRTKLPVLKVRGGSDAKVTIASGSVVGFCVHWLAHRSYMCGGEGCPACLADVGGRWNGVLVVRWQRGAVRRLLLLEVSASTWERFFGLCRMEGWGSLVGLEVHCTRERPKSPLVLDPLGFVEGERAAGVASWRILDAVATLYGLPSAREGESAEDWQERAQPAAHRLIELALRREML